MVLPSLQEHAFWQFSLAVYSDTAVAEACLALQNDYQLDVNMLLFCCWVATQQSQPLTEKALHDALTTVSSWQYEVVQPLRYLRQHLRNYYPSNTVAREQAEQFRNGLKQLELEAEYVEQTMLLEQLPNSDIDTHKALAATDVGKHMAANLNRYCALCGVEQNAVLQQHIMTLIAACSPELAPADVARLLASP